MIKLRSALVLWGLLLLLHIPAKVFSSTAYSLVQVPQSETALFLPVSVAVESAIMPSPVPSAENIPVQLRSPYPLRKFVSVHSLHINLPENDCLAYYSTALYNLPTQRLPIYIAVCLLRI